MTFEELKQTDWYKSRPKVIQQAMDILPPIHYYRFKSTGKQCFIHSFKEPRSGKLEDVTVTVRKTGTGGPLAEMGLGVLDRHIVFGVPLDDLEPIKTD